MWYCEPTAYYQVRKPTLITDGGNGRANWTTSSGATHFYYGTDFDSEFVDDTSIIRGLPAEHWKSKYSG